MNVFLHLKPAAAPLRHCCSPRRFHIRTQHSPKKPSPSHIASSLVRSRTASWSGQSWDAMASILREPWLRARERVGCEIYQDSDDISTVVAHAIAHLVREKQARGLPCVLGLATGSTPMHVYRALVAMHRNEGLSFANVVTFNLDEYFPMAPGALQSYNRFMREHLFDHVDIPSENIHIPRGDIQLHEVPRFCEEYEAAIEAAGGIDLQLLGLGRSGHIGFNERGSSRHSLTRLITLDKVTRVDAAADFFGESNVPRRAITMGVSTILKARRIILMAFGENKAAIVRQAVEGPVTDLVPASNLQEHPSATVMLDYAAAAGLTRVRCPWLLGPLAWDPPTVRKAVVWLSQEVGVPVLKLRDDHYNENSLQDLVAQQGPAYALNLRVFYSLQHTITGWPGGKPPGAPPGESGFELQQKRKRKLAAGGGSGGSLAGSGEDSSPTASDTIRAVYGVAAAGGGRDASPMRRFNVYNGAQDTGPARGTVFPKRVLVMSPHPDDDVISMGGTLIRLVDQGHEVQVGYMTSGNIAVWDEDARRFADFAVQFGHAMGLDTSRTSEIASSIEAFLQNKQPGEVDSEPVQRIKTLVRYCEARSAGRTCGLQPDCLHFLDLPFYQTGTVVKAPLSEKDVELVVGLFERIKPHQIYAAGDLSDPHGTHRVCLQAVFRALDIVRHRPWYQQGGTEVFLYRGAWQEWEPWEADMVVPLSPAELERKIDAIFKHQSQKDRALFPGADPREFWQRAQDRNRNTAQLYDKLGMPEYEAMEAFVRYDPTAPSHLFKAPRPDHHDPEHLALKSA